MTLVYRWLDDTKSIMSFIFHPNSTWDDFYNVCYQAFEEIHTVKHPVDIVIDISRLRYFPRDSIKELLYLTQLQHTNLRYRMLVSNNALFREIYEGFTKLYPVQSSRLYLCQTMEEAHLFIN